VRSLGRTRMKIQEASRDFKMGGIMFHSSGASYLETKTYNDEKSKKLGPESYTIDVNI